MNDKEQAPPDRDLPISAKIRDRLRKAKVRFHANDNIARFIEPGEMDTLHEEVTSKMGPALLWIGVMPNQHSNLTGFRSMRALRNGSWDGRRFRKRPLRRWPNF